MKRKLSQFNVLNKITYKCKNCNWSVSISLAWQDLKPKLCKKCRTSFILNKENLEIIKPIEENKEENDSFSTDNLSTKKNKKYKKELKNE